MIPLNKPVLNYTRDDEMTTRFFWMCEHCDSPNDIHPYDQKYCTECGDARDDSPDADIESLVDFHPELAIQALRAAEAVIVAYQSIIRNKWGQQLHQLENELQRWS